VSTPAPVIEVEGLSKRFDIYPSDRARLLELVLGGKRHAQVWALRDVAFQVPGGSAFGVVGPNGAGKSTLLRVLAGISPPTTGRMVIREPLHSLLDLGAGFHMDFSGRQNATLSCQLLGLSDADVAQRVPRIFEFAEIGEFADHPVRTYSAGMRLRLGFAIAAHLDHRILLIDEVLSVGDAYFQRKCLRRIEQFLADGRTLVLVSHDLHAIRELCSEAIWLDGGRVVDRGEARHVVEAYVDRARDRLGGGPASGDDDDETPDPPATPDGEPPVSGTGEAELEEVRLLDGTGQEVAELRSFQPLTVAVTFRTHEPIEDPVLGVAVFRNDGTYVFGPNTKFDDATDLAGTYDGRYTFSLHYPRLPLLEGTYRFSVAIYDKAHLKPYVWHHQQYELKVISDVADHGLVHLEHEWSLQNHDDHGDPP
jgi:ABC-type polysaccharide/polyol phosphate transport system ATPase subunit